MIEQLTKDEKFSGVTVLVVDYDKDKDTLRKLKIADRSTLVAYKGEAEKKRSSFVTDAAEIRALFESAL